MNKQYTNWSFLPPKKFRDFILKKFATISVFSFSSDDSTKTYFNKIKSFIQINTRFPNQVFKVIEQWRLHEIRKSCWLKNKKLCPNNSFRKLNFYRVFLIDFYLWCCLHRLGCLCSFVHCRNICLEMNSCLESLYERWFYNQQPNLWKW